MNHYYSFLIPRLDGDRIVMNFGHYAALVRKGVAGFILFGGKLDTVRRNIRKLQDEAALPLIVASDLEQGLGQQVKGGTLFPPAMAVAAAIAGGSKKANEKSGQAKEAKKIFSAMAEEASYAGINTVFAPVLDINTNPDNPIISVRSFGEDRETVSFFGMEMITALQQHGIAACAKHFPGHGDTAVDSHIRLPKIGKSIFALQKTELSPFRASVSRGVQMIMLGHLDVPAIDPSGIPASLSEKVVSFIRSRMRYDGILITDAMNMGGVGKYTEEKASALSLMAGVDLLLHPGDPDGIAAYLGRRRIPCNSSRVNGFRWGLFREPVVMKPDFPAHGIASQKLAEDAIRIPGGVTLRKDICVVLLNDEEEKRGEVFVRRLKEKARKIHLIAVNRGTAEQDIAVPGGASCLVCIFSATRAWKGGPGDWLPKKIAVLENRADLFISFGSPYLLEPVDAGKRMRVYWDADAAQEAAAKLVGARIGTRG